MPTFLFLPNEILVRISACLNLPSLLNIRLVNRRLAALVLQNSTSIVPTVARNTFPEAQILLQVSPHERADFDWLKGLVLKFCAAVLVDRLRTVLDEDGGNVHDIWLLGVPAENEIGDKLRSRVRDGLHVFKNLWFISNHVYSEPDREYDEESPFHSRESVIFEKRRQYLTSIPNEDVENWRLAMAFIYAAIRTVHANPHTQRCAPNRRPIFTDVLGINVRLLLQNESTWVNWAILRLGPHVFFRQWAPCSNNDTRHLVRDRILDMWQNTSAEDLGLQKFYARLEEHHWVARDFLLQDNAALREFERYRLWEDRYKRSNPEMPLPRDWVAEVPFFIDFPN